MTTLFIDTCVLFQHQIREILFFLAENEKIQIQWSNDVIEEWRRNIPKSKIEETEKVILHMNERFPNAIVKNYEQHISTIKLNDKADRHIIAAAKEGKADLICTINTKDFPFMKLREHQLDKIHPDTFLSQFIKKDMHSKEILLKSSLSWDNKELKHFRNNMDK